MLRPQSDALVEMLLTVLCNISPYVKCFALESCLKLLSLIERCSRPSYVLRSVYTHHGLVFLLEMVTNIIQYQYEGNTMLVYSVVRQEEVFENLNNLKLKPSAQKTSPNAEVVQPAASGSSANGKSPDH